MAISPAMNNFLVIFLIVIIFKIIVLKGYIYIFAATLIYLG